MKMQVGDDTSAAFATMLPETAETAAVNDDDTRAQRIRVDVVVENEFFDNTPLLLAA
jgi:hypothetical protein